MLVKVFQVVVCTVCRANCTAQEELVEITEGVQVFVSAETRTRFISNTGQKFCRLNMVWLLKSRRRWQTGRSETKISGEHGKRTGCSWLKWYIMAHRVSESFIFRILIFTNYWEVAWSVCVCMCLCMCVCFICVCVCVCVCVVCVCVCVVCECVCVCVCVFVCVCIYMINLYSVFLIGVYFCIYYETKILFF